MSRTSNSLPVRVNFTSVTFSETFSIIHTDPYIWTRTYPE